MVKHGKIYSENAAFGKFPEQSFLIVDNHDTKNNNMYKLYINTIGE